MEVFGLCKVRFLLALVQWCFLFLARRLYRLPFFLSLVHSVCAEIAICNLLKRPAFLALFPTALRHLS